MENSENNFYFINISMSSDNPSLIKSDIIEFNKDNKYFNLLKTIEGSSLSDLVNDSQDYLSSLDKKSVSVSVSFDLIKLILDQSMSSFKLEMIDKIKDMKKSILSAGSVLELTKEQTDQVNIGCRIYDNLISNIKNDMSK